LRLSWLVQGGLSDPGARCWFMCGCDLAALAKCLKDCECKGCLCDGLALCENPGRGGVTRGPGPAKLTFGDETSKEGFKFKEEALPPGALENLQSTVTGVTPGTPPTKGEKGGKPASGALAGAKAGGGSAPTADVRP